MSEISNRIRTLLTSLYKGGRTEDLIKFVGLTMRSVK